ncbi:MAG: hypothetical protein SFW36_01925 [Leptolyngbyaceae cyanobacterium bins.59]|nr:hypothetical protein [Leptolyngbyaceae cyanobacterium bins.59]
MTATVVNPDVTLEVVTFPLETSKVREVPVQCRKVRPIMKWYTAEGKLVCKWVPDTV